MGNYKKIAPISASFQSLDTLDHGECDFACFYMTDSWHLYSRLVRPHTETV